MPMNSTERKHQPKNEFERFFRRITYKDWRLVVRPVNKTHYCLQVQFNAPDAITGEMATQYGRKWLLSKHMTDTELVWTAFKAVLAAEEHETKEQFKFDDTALFNAHLDVNDLAALVTDGKIGIDIRQPPEVAPKKKARKK